MDIPDKRIGWPTLSGLGLLVAAFMVLSLCVTATGTARFAVGMGYDANVGYAVGAIFDLGKGLLLVAVLALWVRRSLGFAVVFAIIWVCLVVYSCLATHATVSTAISGIERTGTWRMEVRGNAKTELVSVEQQLAVLSRPAPPRPAKTVREALAGERVPPTIWRESQECAAIQESVHFAKACAQVVQLRRELAAAQDYEQLSARAGELRKSLAAAAAKAAQLNAFVAVPLAQRYAPFATRARELLAAKRFGPLSHIYVRINRPGPARYPAWDCAWMLDPAEAGGGCLRNLGSHGLDMFLHLTGEEAQVTGAQLSRRAHECPVEDYASVMLRSASGILGTVEVGNGFPRNGTDGEWKIAGRDAILTMKDGIMKLATAKGDETFPGTDVTAPYFTAVRDALDHWQRGALPPISVHDWARAVRLIDQAYERAERPLLATE